MVLLLMLKLDWIVDGTTAVDMKDGLKSVARTVAKMDDGTFDVEPDCGI